jgi:hypothetical protein
MTFRLPYLLYAAIGFGGCSHPVVQENREGKAGAMTEKQDNLAVAEHEPGVWMLRATRQQGGHQAHGEILLQAASAPVKGSLHAAAAGGRAWLKLGQARLQAADTNGAIAAAYAGLEDLGRDYAPPGVRDDTTLKIDAAKERINEGHVADGARVLLRVLDARLQMYLLGHEGTVRLP